MNRFTSYMLRFGIATAALPLTAQMAAAPCVYKSNSSRKVYDGFSKTDCGKVCPIGCGLIESILPDKPSKNKLYAYMALHDIAGRGADKKPAQEFLDATTNYVVSVSINLAGLIIDCT